MFLATKEDMIIHRKIRLIVAILFSSCLHVVNAQQSPVETSFRDCENYSCATFPKQTLPRNVFVIKVSSQDDLKDLNSNVKKAIGKGEKNILVDLAPGVFYYEKLPVYLHNIDAPEVSITIKGDNTIMVAGGKDYPRGSKVKNPNRDHVYLDHDRNLVDLYGEVFQACGKVEVIDEKKKTCRVAVPEPITYVSGMKVQISEWFHSPVYEVTAYKDGFLNFIAHDLNYDEAKKCYNVHYDNRIGEMNPRMRIVDPQRVTSCQNAIHECEVSQFLTLYKIKLKGFTITNLSFSGCAKGKEAMCYFRNVDAGRIVISDCKFENLNYRIVKLKNTGNFVFDNNEVANCYYGAVFSDFDCPNTIITNNMFYRAEKSWTNVSCVACYGEDFLISNNQFEDIGYASISSGYHYNWGKEMVCRGVIENNEISFGDEYYSNPEKYTLMDGGAIYIGTLNKMVIVRYNCIHHYRGVRSNRAIYCDDGAMNVKIYGNVISGVTNAHSIFSWRAKSMNKKLPQSNDGIDVFYNVIWGNYLFDERPNSSCIHGKNLILFGKEEPIPSNTLNNFAYQEEDVIVQGAVMENGKIVFPPTAMGELKQFPTYDKMKKWIE